MDQPDRAGLGGHVAVVMGVSGTGKSTVGQLLAERAGVPYVEGDALHPPANIRKMAAGQPLDDDDRWPWLRTIAAWIRDHHATGAVVTCSALKRAYRDLLRRASDRVFFLHLTGDPALIAERVRDREHPYMPASLLRSQYETLQPLQPDEPGLVVDVVEPPEVLVKQTITALLEGAANDVAPDRDVAR